jgi:hypothetical protein
VKKKINSGPIDFFLPHNSDTHLVLCDFFFPFFSLLGKKMSVLNYVKTGAVGNATPDTSGTYETIDLMTQSYSVLRLRDSPCTLYKLLTYYDSLRGIDVVFIVSDTTAQTVIARVRGSVLRDAILTACGAKLPANSNGMSFFYIVGKLSENQQLRTMAAEFPLPQDADAIETAVKEYSLLLSAVYTRHASVDEILLPIRPAINHATFVPDDVHSMEPLFVALTTGHKKLVDLLNVIHCTRSAGVTHITAGALMKALAVVHSWQPMRISSAVLLLFACLASTHARTSLLLRSSLSAQAAWCLLFALCKWMCLRFMWSDNAAVAHLKKYHTVVPIQLGMPRALLVDKACANNNNSDDSTVNDNNSVSAVNTGRSVLELSSSSSLSTSSFASRSQPPDSITLVAPESSTHRLRSVHFINTQALTCNSFAEASARLALSTQAMHLLRVSRYSTARPAPTREFVLVPLIRLDSALDALWKSSEHCEIEVVCGYRKGTSLVQYHTATRPCTPLYHPYFISYVGGPGEISEFVSRVAGAQLLWQTTPARLRVQERTGLPDVVCIYWPAETCVSAQHAAERAAELTARHQTNAAWVHLNFGHYFPLPRHSSQLPYSFVPGAHATYLGRVNTAQKLRAISRAALHNAVPATSALYLLRDATLLSHPFHSNATTPCTFGTCDTYPSDLCHSAQLSAHMAVATRDELPLAIANMWLRFAELNTPAAWLFACNARLSRVLDEISTVSSSESLRVSSGSFHGRVADQAASSEWNIPRELVEHVAADPRCLAVPMIELHAALLLARMSPTQGIEWSTWNKVGRNLYTVNQSSLWLRALFRWWSRECDPGKFKASDHTGHMSLWEKYARREKQYTLDPCQAMRSLCAMPRSTQPQLCIREVFEAVARELVHFQE